MGFDVRPGSYDSARPTGLRRRLRRRAVRAVVGAGAALAMTAGSLVAVAAGPAGTAAAASTAVVAGFNTTTFGPNDDGSYPCTGYNAGTPYGCTPATVPLPFGLDFFGNNYSAVYINNNGNLTFGQPLATYTPYPLSDAGPPMIAPFFADVDTRVGNTVTFGSGSVNGHPTFGVNWPGVGCYAANTSVLNDFQVLLVDRSDIAPGDFDVEFNYGQIQWDSGQASGGDASCQGGYAARAGYAGGSGATGTYYEIPGSGVDGAFLDSNSATGLIYGHYNSTQPGRYIYQFRNGHALTTSGAPLTANGLGNGTATRYNSTCSHGPPVNCASGDFWHTFTDASVPGRGPGIDLTRTYNSLAASTTGMFGNGWASSYGMNLARNADGTVTITEEDGSQVTASPAGGGSYSVPAWADSVLTENADGTWTFVRQRTRTFTFTAGGKLGSVSDPDGYTTTLHYDGAGRLTSVTDSSGRSLTYAYGPNGLVSSVTDPAGRTTGYSYDSAGDLSSVTDPAGGVTSFAYDSNHLLLSMTDPRGGVVSNVYDSAGRVTSQTDPLGRVTSYSYSGDNYSADGGTTTLTDPNGNVETQRYVSGELMTLTRAAGTTAQAVTTYTYDPETLGRTSVTDPDGHTTSYTYDGDGNRTSVTDPLGRKTTTTYNSLDEPTSITDPSGVTTTITYDARGNPLSESRPLTSTGQTQTASLSYGDSGHPGDVTALTDPDGHTWTFSYDSNGYRTGVTDPLGNKTTYTYDQVGQLVSTVAPDGNAAGANPASYRTTYAYDPLGDLTGVTDPLGHTTSYTYDADRNRLTSTDADGNVTRYSYDADNELTTVTQADGTSLAYGYDADGNRITQTDGSGQITRSVYDQLNQLVSTTDPLGRTTTYGHDPAGNTTSETDARGVTSTYGYDAANELASMTYSDGTPSVAITYTPVGERATMTDGTGTTNYSYDSLGRLTSQTDGSGATVTYGYDLAGNLISLGYPNGKAVTRGYDAADQLTSVTDWLGHTTVIARDASGQPIQDRYGNGVTATTGYNAAGQPTTIAAAGPSGPLASFSYTRDGNGQVTSSSSNVSGATQPAQAYSYTALNQLSSVNSASYSYSPSGSITQIAGTTQLAYDGAGQVLSATTGGVKITYGYDQAGDRTSVSGGPDTSASACAICVLDPSSAGALTATGRGGTPTVSSTGVITVDSASPSAVTAAGNGTVTGSRIYTPGAVAATGHGQVTPAPTAGTTPDPFAGTPAPMVTGTPTALDVTTGTATAQPGVYSSISVSGKGTALTLAPGEYVVAGGALAIAGGAAVKGTGVTLYLACPAYPAPCRPGQAGSALDLSGTATVDLNGAADGSGIAVFSDPANTSSLDISGGSTATVTGHVYAAAARLAVSGQGRLQVNGTVVADQVDVSGGGVLADHGPPHTLPPAAYTYDGAHRLTAISGPGGTTSYAYNGEGLRTSTTTAAGTTSFTWDISGAVPLMLSDGSTSYIYDDSGVPLEQIGAGGVALWYQHDQLGSTRLLTDSSGAVVASYDYSAYGQLTHRSGTADTPLRWAGQYQDASGLYYLTNRYYDPSTAQFLTVDPLVALTQQPYAYAAGNPLNMVDPLGLSWWNPFSWSKNTWKTIGTVAAITGVAAGAALLCVATACIGDVAAAAGATTLAETLSTAATVGDIASTVGTVSTYVAAVADGFQAYDSCRSGFSADCWAGIGAVSLDAVGFGVGHFVDEMSRALGPFVFGSGVVTLLYGYVSDSFVAGGEPTTGPGYGTNPGAPPC